MLYDLSSVYLEATERELEKLAAAVLAGRLLGQDAIGLRVGRILGRYKVGKHFRLAISEGGFGYQRDAEGIAAEAALDAIYVIRTSVTQAKLDAQEVVRSYKLLSGVEQDHVKVEAAQSCRAVIKGGWGAESRS